MSRIIHDLNDFGHDISFSLFTNMGAYEPFALSTESLDTAEKQQQFAHGFWDMFESGNMKAKLRFSAFCGADINAHYFLHEIMHFHQDMNGLYLLPLQEQGTFPILLDAKSDIVAIMFCEAWAEIEAIRSSWALREKGNDSGWRGALKSSDWRNLAIAYDRDLQDGMDEKCAAASIFRLWYEGTHREFYECHGLKIHEENLKCFRDNVEKISDSDISEKLRKLELPMLLARFPKGGIPDYFSLIDWVDNIYSCIKSSKVQRRIDELEQRYGKADNTNIQDIKCGAPPYLWNRLRTIDA